MGATIGNSTENIFLRSTLRIEEGRYYRYEPEPFSALFRNCSRAASPTAPMTASMGFPPLKSMKVGIEKTWNLEERFISSSTLTFPKVIWSAYFLESLSITGSITLQGPHHSAQKSTSKGFEVLLK